MSDEILEGLRRTEGEICDFASAFNKILENIQKRLHNENCEWANDIFELEVEKSIANLSKIKEELNNSNKKIYKENNFRNMMKVKNETNDVLKNLISIEEKIKNFSP